ncbi:pyridoxal phosphate-dependent aminotransferase [Bacillus sp. F19]|nr:pyridoxal phosphate-dependent aminotransferase [Bacillus sp. F19]
MKNFNQSQLLNKLPKQFFASLVGKVNAVIEAGHDVINLGQGNPDQPTPPHIVKALQEAAENPDYHKYSPFRGQKFLKDAIAEFYKREYGVTLNADKEVAILFGGKAGLVEIPQCLLDPDDLVLVPDPGYPDYWSGAELARARMEFMPLVKDNQFLPDYGQLSEEAKKQAKLMFLNYPNNPTGAVASKEFFEETVEFAKENEICVVHDFAYGAIGFDGKKPVSFLEVEGAKETGIEIYTLSKTYNMAGWRIGFAIGNESVIEAINLFQDHMFVSVFSAVQEAAAVALLESQTCVDELVERYESRRHAFITALNEIGWQVEAPPGSFFAWLPVPAGYTSESFAEYLLLHAHVCVAPGVGFGKFGEGYVRAGLLTSEDRLREAAKRIKSLNLF